MFQVARTPAVILATLALVGLPIPRVAAADDEHHESLDLGLSFGPVFPTGVHADGFSTGFGGHGIIGVTKDRMSVRLMMGSDEPGTKDATNQAFSASYGQPLEVDEAIVPVELQGLYRFPLGSSPLRLGVQAGLGAANVTLRIKGTDARISDKWYFGSSAGASLGMRWWTGIIDILCEYRRAFSSPDPTDYVSTQFGITFPLFQ